MKCVPNPHQVDDECIKTDLINMILITVNIMRYTPALGTDPKVRRIIERVYENQEFPKDSINVHLAGFPSDAGIISERRGARMGPKAIRDALYGYSNFCTDHKASLSSIAVIDHGDAPLSPYDYVEAQSTAEEFLQSLHMENWKGKSVFLGGDHSLTEPIIKKIAALNPGEPLGVLLFDSHHDIREPWTHNSGSWGYNILKQNGGPISGDNFIEIGIHGFRYSAFYEDFMRESGIMYYTSNDVWMKGIDEIVSEALNRLKNKCSRIYVSVDIDVLDQAFAPGVSAASPGGLTPRELFSALHTLGQEKSVIGMDMMELSPPLDINNSTIRCASESIAHFLCGVSSNVQSSY